MNSTNSEPSTRLAKSAGIETRRRPLGSTCRCCASDAAASTSVATCLANRLVERLLAADPQATLTVRDLARTPHPALDELALQALFTPAEQRTPQHAERVALDDALIAEIQAADIVVLGVPMYNFG